MAALAATDQATPEAFAAIFRALEADSLSQIGPMQTRLVVIPLQDDAGTVTGGFWGCTNFQWLHIQMLFVPAPQRRQGLGAALIGAAEAEARARHCRGAHVDAFSFQAVEFYERCGYARFGLLPDFPPGYSQHYLFKRL